MVSFNPNVSHRSELLDCIRAVAVTLVLAFHVATRYDVEKLDAVGQWFLRYGFLGVDIFFPLSGFLITGFLLRRTDGASIAVFFMRRFFRIVPLYFLALAVFWAGSIITGFDQHLIDKLWINALFLTGWFVFTEGKDAIPYTITWSLSVEEFAYIIFGLCAWALRKNFVYLLIFLAIAPMLLRFYLEFQGFDTKLLYYYPPTRLDSIAIGGLVAYAHYKNKSCLLILAAGLLAAFALSHIGKAWSNTLLYTQITLATCMLISVFQTYFSNVHTKVTRAMAIAGFYSYFIYLFHFFVIFAMQTIEAGLGLDIGFWAFTVICYLLTLGAAVVSFALFEGPIMAYGRSLETRISAKPA